MCRFVFFLCKLEWRGSERKRKNFYVSRFVSHQAFWICDFSFRFSCFFSPIIHRAYPWTLGTEIELTSCHRAEARCSHRKFREILSSLACLHAWKLFCCGLKQTNERTTAAGKRLHLNFTFQPNFLGRFVPFSSKLMICYHRFVIIFILSISFTTHMSPISSENIREVCVVKK